MHDVWIDTLKTRMFIKALSFCATPHPIPISPNPAQIWTVLVSKKSKFFD